MIRIEEGIIEEAEIDFIKSDYYEMITYKEEPFDLIREEGKLQHYKNHLGTRKVLINIENGNYTVYEKEGAK